MKEFEMRKPVANWLLDRGFFPICEVFTAHMCDFMGVRFAPRLSRRIPELHRAIAVELKLSDFNGVYRQAYTNSYYANESWVVMPQPILLRSRAGTMERFKNAGIGVASLNDGVVTVVQEANDTGRKCPDRMISTLWRRSYFGDLKTHKCLEDIDARIVPFGYQSHPSLFIN